MVFILGFAFLCVTPKEREIYEQCASKQILTDFRGCPRLYFVCMANSEADQSGFGFERRYAFDP